MDQVKDPYLIPSLKAQYPDSVFISAKENEGIEELILKNEHPDCIKRLRTRQQSFVFFMMVRMLKSTMPLSQVKSIMNELAESKAYPLNSFIGDIHQPLHCSRKTDKGGNDFHVHADFMQQHVASSKGGGSRNYHRDSCVWRVLCAILRPTVNHSG